MEINPYQSPEQSSDARPAMSPRWQVFAPREPRKILQLDRPALLTWLCLAQVAVVALLFAVNFGPLFPAWLAGLHALSIPAAPYMILVLASWVFALIATGGMWEGTRWGWWCGAYSCAHGLWHSLFGIAQVVILVNTTAFAGRPEAFLHALVFTLRILVGILTFSYFFSSEFLAYVGRAAARRGATAAMLIALAAMQQLLEIGLLYLLH
jgi:hypothetical protein